MPRPRVPACIHRFKTNVQRTPSPWNVSNVIQRQSQLVTLCDQIARCSRHWPISWIFSRRTKRCCQQCDVRTRVQIRRCVLYVLMYELLLGKSGKLKVAIHRQATMPTCCPRVGVSLSGSCELMSRRYGRRWRKPWCDKMIDRADVQNRKRRVQVSQRSSCLSSHGCERQVCSLLGMITCLQLTYQDMLG